MDKVISSGSLKWSELLGEGGAQVLAGKEELIRFSRKLVILRACSR